MEAACTVWESQALTPTTHAIRIQRPKGFEFEAGQHAMMEIQTANGLDDRFLSIASGPNDDSLEFAVRLSDSDFKQAFRRLSEGDDVTITGPSGRFKRDPERPAILVSGGIGITPLRSMLRDAKQRDLPATRLLYGNRSPDDIPYHHDLTALRGPNISITQTVDQPSPDWKGKVGHIGPELINEARFGLEEPIFYLCGPPGIGVGTGTNCVVLELGQASPAFTLNVSWQPSLDQDPSLDLFVEGRDLDRIVEFQATAPHSSHLVSDLSGENESIVVAVQAPNPSVRYRQDVSVHIAWHGLDPVSSWELRGCTYLDGAP